MKNMHFFQALTELSVNYWLAPLLLLTPAIWLVSRNNRSPWQRLAITLILLCANYACINLALHTERHLGWQNYEQCRQTSVQPMDSPEMHAECAHHIHLADGASTVFYLVLGWLPAMGYLGMFIWLDKRRGHEANPYHHFVTVRTFRSACQLLAVLMCFCIIIGLQERLFQYVGL